MGHEIATSGARSQSLARDPLQRDRYLSSQIAISAARSLSLQRALHRRRQRADFPVDTHVWKIAIALGWVPKTATRDQTYEHLNRRVPNEIKHELHVLLVEYGKLQRNCVKQLRQATSVPQMAPTMPTEPLLLHRTS